MGRAESASQLLKLMKEEGRRELKCGEILKRRENIGVLLSEWESFVATRDAELRTPSGDLDMLVVGKETATGGDERNVLYVWELKDPSLPLFEVEAATRAQPTKELYSAENQLLHYFYEVRGSEAERSKYGVVASADVRLGGIVMGRDGEGMWKKKGNKEISSTDAYRVAKVARDVRQEVFYKVSGVRLITWDRIVSRLQSVTQSNVEVTASGTVDPGIGPAFTGSLGNSPGS